MKKDKLITLKLNDAGKSKTISWKNNIKLDVDMLLPTKYESTSNAGFYIVMCTKDNCTCGR